MKLGIDFDEEQMKALVSEALLASFDEQQKAIILQKAIAFLLTPEPGGYGSSKKKSVLETAFENAATNIAHQMAADQIRADEVFLSKIREMIAEAAARIFLPENRERIVGKMADALMYGMFEK